MMRQRLRGRMRPRAPAPSIGPCLASARLTVRSGLLTMRRFLASTGDRAPASPLRDQG